MQTSTPAMPRSLRIVRVAVTVLTVGFLAAVVAGALDLVPARIGYSIGGRAVSRGEWLRLAAPLLAISAAWFAAGAVGLWRERSWSRRCIVSAFATVAGFALMGLVQGIFPPALAVRAVVQAALFGAVSEVYLYHSRAVSAYFDALREPR
jgi:hypothetical protein